MSNIHKCAVKSCQSEINKLFRCPESRSQAKKWKNILEVSDKEFYVCELHFDAHFISYEKVLSDQAVPTIFINDKHLVNQYCACCSNPISEGHQIGQLHIEIHRILFSNFDLNGEYICLNCNNKMIGINDFIKIVEDNRKTFESVDVEMKEPIVKIETVEYEVLSQEDITEVEENMLFIKPEDNRSEPEYEYHQSEEEESQHKKSKPLKQETKVSNFKCEVCTATFDTRNGLIEHVLNIHAYDQENMDLEQSYIHLKNKSRFEYQKCDIKCPECGKKVKYYTYKSHVLSIHSTKRDWICEQCGKGFALMSSLYAHIKSMHDRTTYECDICGFTCFVKYRIKKHLNETHNKYIKQNRNEAFTCPICLKIQTTFLDAHMKKYHPNNYDSGVRVNPETNKYHCPKCSQSFMSIHHYEQHVNGDVCLNFEKYEVEDNKRLTITTLGRFTCSICKTVKPTLVKLRRHITTFHSGKKTCLICSKTQKNQKQFLKHVNCYHKLTMKEYKAKATELGHIL